MVGEKAETLESTMHKTNTYNKCNLCLFPQLHFSLQSTFSCPLKTNKDFPGIRMTMFRILGVFLSVVPQADECKTLRMTHCPNGVGTK